MVLVKNKILHEIQSKYHSAATKKNLTTISHDGCAKLPHKLVNLHFVKIPEAR